MYTMKYVAAQAWLKNFYGKDRIVKQKLANRIQTKAYENQTYLPDRRVFLNCVGLLPVCFLKKLLKCVGSGNPSA